MTIHCFSDLVSAAALMRAGDTAVDLKLYANALAGAKRLDTAKGTATGATAADAVLASLVKTPTTYAQLAWSGEAMGDTSHALLLRADPVHYLVRRNAMTLVALAADARGQQPNTLSIDEANTLAASLNKHFSADSLTIHVTDAARWYITSVQPLKQQPQLVALRDASGLPVFDCMPTRDAAASSVNWAGLGNEVQMLLHEHPVNLERERRGHFPVNAIWFWGSNEIAPQSSIKPKNVVCLDPFHLLAVRGACKQASLQAPLTTLDALQPLAPGDDVCVLEESSSDAVVQSDAKAFHNLVTQQARRVTQLSQLAKRMGTTLLIQQCPAFSMSLAASSDKAAQNSAADSNQLAYALPTFEFGRWSRLRVWAKHSL